LECSYVTGIGTAINSTKILDELEKEAIVDAGNAGGQFLDEVGTTDLATLTSEDFAEFVKRVVLEFGDSIRRQIRAGKPPF